MTARYSALKAFKFPDRIEALREGRVAGPVHVQVVLSDLCSQSCNFCSYRDPDYTSSKLFHEDGNYNPHRMLPFAKVIEVLDDCQELGVKAVQFTGGGEPTIYPQFAAVIDAVNARGLAWAVVTNGVRARDLSTATWVRVSLDAAKPETYASIRHVPVGHFHKACETIRKWKTGVGFVVTPDNWSEVYDGALLARDLGASNIRIGAQFSADGRARFDGFADEAAALARQAEGLSSPTFQVVNRFGEKLDDLETGRPEYSRCGFQRFTTYVGGDQNLYRCCIYAYNERGKIASLKDQRLRDVWRNEAQADFAQFDARGCERCQFNVINRAINEVLTPDPSEGFV